MVARGLGRVPRTLLVVRVADAEDLVDEMAGLPHSLNPRLRVLGRFLTEISRYPTKAW